MEAVRQSPPTDFIENMSIISKEKIFFKSCSINSLRYVGKRAENASYDYRCVIK